MQDILFKRDMTTTVKTREATSQGSPPILWANLLQLADIESGVAVSGWLQPQPLPLLAQPPAAANHSTKHQPTMGQPSPHFPHQTLPTSLVVTGTWE